MLIQKLSIQGEVDVGSTKTQPVVDPKVSTGVTVDPETSIQGEINQGTSIDPKVSIDITALADPSPTVPNPIGTLTTASGQTGLVVGSQTITPGAPAVTISVTTFSLASSGSIVFVNSASSSLLPEDPAPLLTTKSDTAVVIGSQTFLAGSSAVTIGGTTYSLAPSGNALIVGGTSQYLLASQTLVAGGPAITVSGVAVSLQNGGESVVVGSSTLAIESFAASETSSGLGGIIASIGGFTSDTVGVSPTGYNGATFTGAAVNSRKRVLKIHILGWVVSLGLWNGVV